jgi:hypothetical protein
MSMIQSGWALAGILVVASISKPVMLDALSWITSRASGYLQNGGGDVFAN